MLGTFTYHNPTKIYFGPNALEGLANELQNTARTSYLSTAAAPSRKTAYMTR